MQGNRLDTIIYYLTKENTNSRFPQIILASRGGIYSVIIIKNAMMLFFYYKHSNVQYCHNNNLYLPSAVVISASGAEH